MDAEEIVREMRRSNQGKDEIVANLRELGIAEPEKYYERVIASEGKGVLIDSQKIDDISEPEVESMLGEAEKDDAKYGEEEGYGKESPTSGNSLFGSSPRNANSDDSHAESKDILKSETKSLFENKGRGIYSPEPTSGDRKRADDAMEGIPKLEITSIKDGNEKVSDIEEMMGKRKEPLQIMKSMPQTSLQNLDAVERKLDELISLTKAVYEIDRKILEANRDLILRFKTQK
ncbi:MAG: hypothetical protein AABX01_03730 [Candidatus Micrarchaeota archaeon]